MIPHELFKKYDVPAPRYTSYPTVPYWKDSPTTDQWITELNKVFDQDNSSWSMYLHVPFCETLCTFCGCNTSITKDHNREMPYRDLLIRELDLYLQKVPKMKMQKLKQIHFGGGSPTFLSAETLSSLVRAIYERVNLDKENFVGSIEVDPRRTKPEQLKALADLGFTRVSMGVQDYNPEVQRLVNRIQPREMTEKLTLESRKLGYTSVNFDLIYGLPKQTPQSIREMAESTLLLKPDRIALYSFALVPWIKPAQRLFKDEDLPQGEEKRELYEIAREILIEGGYIEIGMDHFALPHDALAVADREKKLHRNFMGYVEERTDVLLGLGVSSISEAPTCFHQNEKALPVYERRILQNEIPTLRGHLLSSEDQKRREQILEFMTKWEVELESDEQLTSVRDFLKTLIDDEIVYFDKRKMKLTPRGRPFLRNACMSLDERLRREVPNTKVFSQSL